MQDLSDNVGGKVGRSAAELNKRTEDLAAGLNTRDAELSESTVTTGQK
jgi:hypothetical protein